ncbi:unnamed protein product [Orchesella dallaii]|uniref:Uncharacterized protein n=1 Tax=Orchesella dallaii TaxID=48710 RepID=A0ABP1S840_9HEXA
MPFKGAKGMLIQPSNHDLQPIFEQNWLQLRATQGQMKVVDQWTRINWNSGVDLTPVVNKAVHLCWTLAFLTLPPPKLSPWPTPSCQELESHSSDVRVLQVFSNLHYKGSFYGLALGISNGFSRFCLAWQVTW